MMQSTFTLAVIYIIIGATALVALGLCVGGAGRYLGSIASLCLCYWRLQGYVDDSTLAYLLMGTAIAGGLLAGIPAWFAGGRWREASLPTATVVLVIPFLHLGYSFDGIQGLKFGLLFGWAFALSWIALALLLMSVKPTTNDTDRRTMAWGATVATGPVVILSPVAGHWLYAAESSALFAAAWSWVVWHRSWHALEVKLDAWIDRRAYRIALAGSAFWLTCPALVAQALPQAEPRPVHLALLFAHRVFHDCLPGTVLIGIVIPVSVAAVMAARSTRTLALFVGPCFVAPIVWILAANYSSGTFVTVAALTAAFGWAAIAWATGFAVVKAREVNLAA